MEQPSPRVVHQHQMQSGNAHAACGTLSPANYGLDDSRIATLNAQYAERVAAQVEENKRKEQEKIAKKEAKRLEKQRKKNKGSVSNDGGGERTLSWSSASGGESKGFEHDQTFKYEGAKGTSLDDPKVEREKRGLIGFFKRGSKGGKEDDIVR
jgi:hypothetical protein